MNKHDMARERLIFKCIMFYDNFYFKGRNIGIDFNCDGKPDMNLINNLASIQLKVFKSDHPQYSLEKLNNNPIREDEIESLIQKPLIYFYSLKILTNNVLIRSAYLYFFIQTFTLFRQ